MYGICGCAPRTAKLRGTGFGMRLESIGLASGTGHLLRGCTLLDHPHFTGEAWLILNLWIARSITCPSRASFSPNPRSDSGFLQLALSAAPLHQRTWSARSRAMPCGAGPPTLRPYETRNGQPAASSSASAARSGWMQVLANLPLAIRADAQVRIDSARSCYLLTTSHLPLLTSNMVSSPLVRSPLASNWKSAVIPG